MFCLSHYTPAVRPLQQNRPASSSKKPARCKGGRQSPADTAVACRRPTASPAAALGPEAAAPAPPRCIRRRRRSVPQPFKVPLGQNFTANRALGPRGLAHSCRKIPGCAAVGTCPPTATDFYFFDKLRPAAGLGSQAVIPGRPWGCRASPAGRGSWSWGR